MLVTGPRPGEDRVVLGDLGSWVIGVFSRIGDVSVYWLLLALALKTAESALIGVGWRNILNAAYPGSRVSFRTAWGGVAGWDRDQCDRPRAGGDRGEPSPDAS